MTPPLTILDGAMGTELGRRGADLSGRAWSARALIDHPDLVGAVHAAYVDAGATIHTANTFRTRKRDLPEDWDGGGWLALTRRAIDIARLSVPEHHRVAASLSPLEDCYRPDLSPGEAGRAEHREFALALVEARADVVICETFPHVQEAIIAVEECVEAGAPQTWVSFTAGPRADLLSPQEAAQGAAPEAVDHGAHTVLVNCVAATLVLPYVRALADAVGDRVPIGVYANAGEDRNHIGWGDVGEEGPRKYAQLARQWIDAGASIIGGCCGTDASHIAWLARLFAP